jgi:hypothetical protein
VSTEDEQDRADRETAPAPAGPGEPVMVAYGELRRAVHERGARASIEQAQAALVRALAVAPEPRP